MAPGGRDDRPFPGVASHRGQSQGPRGCDWVDEWHHVAPDSKPPDTDPSVSAGWSWVCHWDPGELLCECLNQQSGQTKSHKGLSFVAFSGL